MPDHARGWDLHMHTNFSVERKLQLPLDAPARLLEDIATYSALVELQSKMSGSSFWYSRLA